MSQKGEIIQIHVGQAGVQIANACWELYCLEHGINADGHLETMPSDNAPLTFFDYRGANRKVVPRVVMIDTEPTVIDEIRGGIYSHLFHPDSLVTGDDDSGSNFGRGYNVLAHDMMDRTLNAVRHMAEDCNNLRGFLVFRSIGGGTGSGLGTRLLEQLNEFYGSKVSKLEFIIFPSPSLSPVIVEPYNALLATHFSMDHVDCSFIVDNEALYEICASKLNVPAPTYTNLNRIIGQVVSTFTASQRFSGPMNVTLEEFYTNLVPYPRIHYPLLSYSPLVAKSRQLFDKSAVDKLTEECFLPGNQLVRCHPQRGKYMSCVLLYRGDVSPNDINVSIQRIRNARATQFVDWSPTGFKVGVNSMPPSTVPTGDLAPSKCACCALTNNTIIRTAWCRVVNKFNKLYDRRAFVYHYVGEGMEESNLSEASENICQLSRDYQDVEATTNLEDDPSEEEITSSRYV